MTRREGDPFGRRYWARADRAGKQHGGVPAGLMLLGCLALAGVNVWAAMTWHPLVLRVTGWAMCPLVAWWVYQNRRADRLRR